MHLTLISRLSGNVFNNLVLPRNRVKEEMEKVQQLQ